MCDCPHRRGRGRAFTLVELLVVIGIIAVLMGVLLPALTAARAQSRSVACLSNLRQLSTAALMYAQETKRFVGYVAHVAPRKPIDRNELLYPYLKQGKATTDTAGNQVWHCPANERFTEEASYGFNTYLNGVKLNQIRRWSETVSIVDAGLKDTPAGAPSLATHCWPPGRTGSTSSCRPNHLRHPKQTVSVGFVDGHAERLPMKPPFYPGVVGAWNGNDVKDIKHPDYKDQLWDLN